MTQSSTSSLPQTRPAQQARILWQVRCDTPVGRRLLPIASGVIVPTGRGSRTAIRRIGLSTGDTLWEATLDAPAAASIARTGRTLAVPLTAGRLASLDILDGAPTPFSWQRVMGELADPVYAHGGRVYLRLMPGTGARLVAFEVGRDAPLWTVTDPTRGASGTRLAVTRDRLIVAGAATRETVSVTAFDLADGQLRWQQDKLDGQLLDLWALAGVIDVLTSEEGLFGLDAETGAIRSHRHADLPSPRAWLAGDSLLALTKQKSEQTLFCMNAMGEQVTGRLREPQDRLERVIGAHPGEVLVSRPGGAPALYRLPGLEPIALPEADAIGPTHSVTWARDVAYLVSEDRHTITALELQA